MKRIYRYEVPVDDAVHRIELQGQMLAVGCRDPRVVEFWAEHEDAWSGGQARLLVVVGTGHPVPLHAIWKGMAVAPGGQLVWHLLEVDRYTTVTGADGIERPMYS